MNNFSLMLDSYSTRAARSKKLHPAESLFSSSWIANLLTVAFVAVDLMTLYSVWNMYLMESPGMLIVLAIGFALILDVPLAIAGNALKQAEQGLRPMKEARRILILSVLAFLIVFVLSFGFRLSTREDSFTEGSVGGLTGLNSDPTASETAESEGDSSKLLAALCLGTLPAATSLSSFAINYMVSNPLTEQEKLLESERAALQSQIADIEAALAECDNIEAYYDELIRDEKTLYDVFLKKIDSQGIILKERFRLLLMEATANPESISRLSESAQSIIEHSKADALLLNPNTTGVKAAS